MKSKKAVPIALFTLTFLLIGLSVLAPFSEERWRTSQVSSADGSFVQIETTDDGTRLAYSSPEGVMLAEKKVRGSLTERLAGETDIGWEKKLVSNKSRSGYYLSMEVIDGEIALAHQYGPLGNRKLGYTYRTNGSWITEQVDPGTTGSGIEPGMYASLTHLEDRPVILYHTAERDRFMKAEKINGSWEREELGEGRGQYLSTDSCGDKVFAIFRSRQEQSIYRGNLSGKYWVSEPLNGDTDGAMSVDTVDCDFRAAYHNSKSGMITYIEEKEPTEIAEGRLSRVSLDHDDEPEIVFYRQGEGLYHASREEKEWITEPIDTGREYAGERNELDIRPDGTATVVYTAEKGIYYAENSKGYSPDLTGIIRMLALLCAIPAMLSLLYLEEELLLLKSKVFKQAST